MKRTAEEIQKQITRLEEIKSSGPSRNSFGDDNNLSVNIQLSILKGERGYSYYSNEPQQIESVAYETKEWMKGEESDLFGED